MTFASRMQHKIYWGRLKKLIEWSLKTILAPWAYIASVVYHDSFWYPTHQKIVRDILHSSWGRLFQNWDQLALQKDDLETRGWANIGDAPAELKSQSMKLFLKPLRILSACIREAPEFGARRRLKKAMRSS